MPLYEYQCDACGEHEEILQKFSDAPETKCPHCHKPQLNRIISATHFQLKGTGWYETDFKNKGNAAKPDKKAVSTKSTPAAKKSETSNTSGDSSTKKD